MFLTVCQPTESAPGIKMTKTSPVIYLLHGNDEFAIRSFLKDSLIPKMGGGADATMDITNLDGRTDRLEAIQGEVQTIPFLSKRRMVIIDNPISLTKSKDKIKEFFDSIPETTALVLIEGVLAPPRKNKNKQHWLLEWVQMNSDRCWAKGFTLPTGQGMTNWIQEQAAEMGGHFEVPAAQLLASLIDEDPRLANMEINKLLTYVDFARPVNEADVAELVSDVRPGDIFDMVDAIGYGDGKKAMFMLRRLLEHSDALPLFGMIVRQFRLLIQVRELVDENPTQDHFNIAKTIGSHPYPIKKIMPQVKLFSLDQLKIIFHQLSDVDQAIKTGKLDGALALDLLVASLTQ
jgi:DNA polymerase-3 subunit delta